MSLLTLRNLRLQGQRPSDVITVFIGSRPKWKEDGPALIVMPADAQPGLMDFRPLVGLWVALVTADDSYELAAKTMTAIKDAGAKFFGAAFPCGTYPCIQNPTPEHHRVLRETRELLCQS